MRQASLKSRWVSGSILIASALALPVTTGVSAASGATRPHSVISSVTFSGSPGDYTVTIKGSRLGILWDGLPSTGTVPYLCLLDNALHGDPVRIGIYASGDAGDGGPQTAWAGLAS